MDTYLIVIIVVASVILATLLFLMVAGFAFFMGIFKRKKYSELGEKSYDSPQRKMVIEERRKAIAHARTLDFEQLEVKSFDGLTLRGRLFPSNQNDKKSRVVICVHGFTSHSLREFGAYIPSFDKLGVDALLVDDRAHGDSDGKYTGFSILDRIDVKEWVKLMKARYDEVYLCGISMGAATVAMVASDMPDDIAGVIFDCGFTSPIDSFEVTMRRVCSKLSGRPIYFFGRFWCKLFLGFDFAKVQAVDIIKGTKCPFLFIQGDKDPTVPLWMSNKMYEACSSQEKRQEVFAGAEHVGCFYVDNERYNKLLEEFFN